MKHFDFDESFQRNHILENAKMHERFATEMRRVDEYDKASLQDMIFSLANEISLNVTKSVLKEYHHYLSKYLGDSE